MFTCLVLTVSPGSLLEIEVMDESTERSKVTGSFGYLEKQISIYWRQRGYFGSEEEGEEVTVGYRHHMVLNNGS